MLGNSAADEIRNVSQVSRIKFLSAFVETANKTCSIVYLICNEINDANATEIAAY